MEETVRGFVHFNRSWYAEAHRRLNIDPDVLDEVMFGIYTTDSGTTGEMAMRWYELDGVSTPRLEVFCDGWRVLSTFSDLIAALAERDGQDITPEQFCALLVSLGFEDRTEATR